MLRIILIPFFVVFLLGNFSAWSKWMALAIFVIASLTDMLDGYLARRDNLVTNFGKFMDPLADKLLVCSAMICLVDMSRIPSWIVIIIIGREFVISGFRLIASDNGVVIAANYWGKCKTVCQMFMIIILIANLGGGCDCGADSDLCLFDPDRDFSDHIPVAEPQCSFHAGIEYNN